MSLGFVVALLGVLCAGVGFLWMPSIRRTRAAHDKCVRTLVVRTLVVRR